MVLAFLLVQGALCQDGPASSHDTSVPSASKCVLILTISFVLVNLVMYVVQQIKFFKGMFLPNLQQIKGEELLSEMFNDRSLGNARSALSFIPVVSLLMMFIMFRAENQDIDIETSGSYQTAEVGMWITTIGILIQAVDGMLVNIRSPAIALGSEIIGSVLTYAGFIFLMIGMFTVRSSIIPMSVAAKCLVALATLLLVLMIVMKAVQLKKKLAEDRTLVIDVGVIGEMIDEHHIQEIQSSAQFSHVMMIAFFYLHFRYVRIGNIPDIAESGIIASTVGVYLQAIAIITKLKYEQVGSILNILGLLLVYGAFSVTMYAAIDAGWPAPSLAIQVVLILLFVIAFLKLVIVITQEVSSRFLNNADETEPSSTQGESFARMTKLFQDMMATTAYANIVCILLLFIHFRAAFLLKQEPQEFISNTRGLPAMMYLVMFSIFAQMIAQIIELGLGPHGLLSVSVSIAIAGINIGVGGIAIAAVSA